MMQTMMVPTRGRMTVLPAMVDSLTSTVARVRDFELLFAVDDDDAATKTYCENVTAPFRTRTVVRENPRSLRQKYIPLEQIATGEIWWYGADDFVFRTPGWDAMVADRYAALPPHKIAMFALADGFEWHNVKAFRTPCGLPGLTREWIAAAGYTLPPYFEFNCLETFLWGLALRLEQAGHAECRQHCLDIMAEHIHHSNGKRPKDGTDEASEPDLPLSCKRYEQAEVREWEDDFRRLLREVER